MLSLAVMRPHPQDENFFLAGDDLVDDPVLEMDPAGKAACQLAAEGCVA